jgi:hypothetical protein
MGYVCQFHEGEAEAKVLLTTLTNGQTMSSCTEDAPVMLVGALASALGTDTAKLWDAIKRHTERQAKAEAKAAPAAPQDPPAEIQGECPYCHAAVMAPPEGIEAAAAAHLRVCEQAPDDVRAVAP